MSGSVYRSVAGKTAVRSYYKQILLQWPQPNAHHYVSTHLGKTFVISSGVQDGGPVVFLHGASTNSAMWTYDAAVVGRTHRVYSVDIVGEPGSSSETRPNLKPSNYADWLAEVLDGLGIDTASIVGNSLGGWIALDFATAYPDRVRALVLLAPGGICAMLPSYVFKAAALSMLGKKGADRMSRMVLGDIPLPREVAEFAALLRAHYIPRRLKIPVFSDDALKRLTMPVLYVGGDHDIFFPSRRCAERLHALLSHANVRVLENTRHALVNMADDISAFLKHNGV